MLLLLACAAPLTLQATPAPDGVEVHTSAPVTSVVLEDPDGVPIERRTLPAPTDTLRFDVGPGRYVVRSGAASATVEVLPAAALRAEVQVAPGAPWVPLEGTIDVPVVPGGTAEVLVGVAGRPADVPSTWGTLSVTDARQTRTVRVQAEDVPVRVGDLSALLHPRPVELGALEVVGTRFPAFADGTPDVGRPDGVIPVPAPAWDALVRRIGVGSRRRDELAPWAFVALTLHNRGDVPIDLGVRQSIDDPAFAPRLRESDGGTGAVSALVRVPARGDVTAALPVFVDLAAARDGAYVARLELTPLGGDTPIQTVETTLHVQHGDPVAHVGFGSSVLLSLTALGWFVRRLRGWLEASPTSELMTIALFGSAIFVTGSVADLVTMALGAALGPFATLVTGLFSDVGRAVLLGTLLSLRPRPGTLALATVTGYLLRGLAMGSFAVADVVYLGSAIGIQEALAWIVGLSRGRRVTAAGLVVLLGGSSVLTTLVGLWLHIVLYRLYFADWYVLLQVLVPGLLYHTIAALVAARLAGVLGRVRG